MSNESSIEIDVSTTNESTNTNEPTLSSECKLTTFDNPFDPFEQFDQWFMYDVEKGYYSCSRLARIAEISDDMTQKEIDEEIERAIDVIVENDFTNTYKKVKKQNKITTT